MANGIADSPNSLAVPQSAGAISADVDVTPGVGEMMRAFREGFITVEDITKRAADKPLENAQRREALADTNLIRPKQRQVASQQLDIQSRSLGTQAEAQPKLDAAALANAEGILAKAQRGNDKQALLDFYQQVAAPGQLPPKIDPNDPASDYDYAKIQDTNSAFIQQQRALQTATSLGKFVKSYTTKEKTSTGGETESVVRFNELTGEKIGAPTVIGESAPQADVLRKEYNALPELHDLRKVSASYGKLLTALDDTKQPTAFRDQSAIFSWMKILDPGSTVREGEYATAKNAAGVPDRVRNYFNQAVSGQILTPQQRAEMKEAALPIYNAQVQTLAPQVNNYLKREQDMGLPPGTIVPADDASLVKNVAAPAAAPVAGAAPAAPSANPDVPVKVNSPKDAPPTAKFIQAPDGRVFKNPNYRPANTATPAAPATVTPAAPIP